MKLTIAAFVLILLGAFWAGPPPEEPLTANGVIEKIKENLTCEWSQETVDTFKTGDPDTVVTGIVCTFTATIDVLKKAAELGCNLIITHEPTFYNHTDSREMLRNDPVYAAKMAVIEEYGLVIFRFHDHWHRTTPDGINKGMVEKMQWDTYVAEGESTVFNFRGLKLFNVTDHLKQVFPDADIRVIGNPRMDVKKVAFLAGAPGSGSHIRMLQQEDIDLIVIGEAREWETVEYVRDAVQSGHSKSVIILGHVVSEEAGMEYCAEWISSFLPEIPVHFVPAGDPFNR